MESYYVTLNHIITFNFQSLIMRISSLNHSHLEQTCTNISNTLYEYLEHLVQEIFG